MMKMILIFSIVFTIVYYGIALIWAMPKSQKRVLTKSALYAIIIAVVTTLLLSTIVFLF